MTVQETRDDVSSKFSVYSLLFPPVSLEKYIANNSGGSVSRVWLVLAVAVVVGGGVWIVYKWRRNSGKGEAGKAVRQDKEQLLDASDTTKMERQAVDAGTANSMYLFGDFSVFDRSGRNISYMFSLRIKQIFCLILRYSDADGISSKQLSDLIWPDKPKDKVKNSRGVAINHCARF